MQNLATWQTDPKQVKTRFVKLYEGDQIIAEGLTLEHARALVKKGRAYVISMSKVGKLRRRQGAPK